MIPGRTGTRAFTLVEVVLALGISAFVLVAMIALFSTGLQAIRESEEQVQAANLASQILVRRLAASQSVEPEAIPASALTGTYGDPFGGADMFVDFDGQTSTSADGAAYRLICRAGTNSFTGPQLSQVYLMLAWPPQADLANASGSYETLTYIPIR